MIGYIVKFLILLSPFALFVYLHSVMEDLSRRDFLSVILKASITSVLIFIIFAMFGTLILEDLLSIEFESFKIFGGIVLVAFAVVFIVQGKQSFFTLKGSLDNLASEIALPFMVGAATVSLSIVMGNSFSHLKSIFVILSAMIVNYGIIVILLYLKYDVLKRNYRKAFDKIMGTISRLNGFIIGSIGINMIYEAIKHISHEAF